MKNHKLIVSIVLLAAVAVAGYFIITRNPTPPVEEMPVDTASQEKLNIDLVCASALAYMTFENAAAADTFVAECKEGKHPEVIERYKADMNLGDGAAI